MSPLLLTAEELSQLTGYEIRAKQCAELGRMKIPYILNTRGHLCVARAAAEQRLGVASAAANTEEPDFSVFQ